MRRIVPIAVFVALSSALWCSAASALTLRPIGNFEHPIYITSDPVNPERLLVVEREGKVEEVSPSGVEQFADLNSPSKLVSCCEGERGLLSIVPAPDFGSSSRFYAAYTGRPAAGGQEGDVHVDSFRPSPQGGLVREPIVTIDHSQYSNHNGGQLQFGPDGHLYISLGDGGGGGDPLGSGQSTESLLGKILRIDPRPGQAPAYSIPVGNPFAGMPGRDEIWALGLRNPWRFSFDRATGAMVIGDVGQDEHEEVDFAPSPGGGAVSGGGANYGWNCREGFSSYSPGGCGSAGGFTEPAFDYPHEDPGGGAAHGCSIIGGYVVRDASLDGLYGRYVYTDFCTGEIRSLALPAAAGGQASGDRPEGLSVADPTSLGEDSCGRIYVASNDGTVYRLVGPTPAVCPVAVSPADVSQKRKRHRTRLRLRAKDAGSRVKIVVRVSPCAGHAGDRVQLNRGGHRVSARRLDRKCVARFFARVNGRATFRALLGGSSGLRSRRLALDSRRLR